MVEASKAAALLFSAGWSLIAVLLAEDLDGAVCHASYDGSPESPCQSEAAVEVPKTLDLGP